MSGLFCDQGESALQFAQGAGAGQMTFGEQAHGIALAQGCDDDADGFARLLAVDAHRVKKTHEPAHRALFHEHLIHHKTHRPATCRRDEKRIGVGHMIRQQQDPAAWRQVLEAHRAYMIDRAHQGGTEHPDEMSRQQPDDEQGHQRADDAGHRDLHAQPEHGTHAERMGDEGNGLERRRREHARETILKIHRGLQLAALVRRIAVLHPRIQRCQKHRRT